MLDSIKRYGMGMGGNLPLQHGVDLGASALIGAGIQQGLNWITPGADPNPLISGVMMAPSLSGVLRLARVGRNPNTLDRNLELSNFYTGNPIGQSIDMGSATSLIGGGATSLYNSIIGGEDYDPNSVAAGVAAIGALFPLASKLAAARRNQNRAHLGSYASQ